MKISQIAYRKPMLAKIFAEIQYMALIFQKAKAEKINEIIKMFISPHKLNNKKYFIKLQKDILAVHFEYLMGIEDYFYYELEKKSAVGRQEYVGHAESNKIYDRISQNQAGDIFRDKYKCYETFKTYYKRTVIKIVDNSDFQIFQQFSIKHDKFIVKPLDAGLGEGIFKVEITPDYTVEKVFKDLLAAAPVVIEELIVEVEAMAKFHPASVNTVRFATYIDQGKVKDLYATLRLGDAGRIVDNASSGGISADIDLKTGIVCSKGFRKNGETFIVHPNTNVQIVGAHIPKWNELKESVHKLATIIPQRKVVGWDMALTENGWVMIEGNHHLSPESVQITKQRGIRADLEKLL